MNDREIERFDLGLPVWNDGSRYQNKIPAGCKIHGFERDPHIGRTFALIERPPVEGPLDLDKAKAALRGGVPAAPGPVFDAGGAMYGARMHGGMLVRDAETEDYEADQAGLPPGHFPVGDDTGAQWTDEELLAMARRSRAPVILNKQEDEGRAAARAYWAAHDRAWRGAPELLRHLGAMFRMNKALVCEFSNKEVEHFGGKPYRVDYHDYADGAEAVPIHGHTYRCVRCKKEFTI